MSSDPALRDELVAALHSAAQQRGVAPGAAEDRAALLADALLGLPRVSAPAALDGAVVAALHAGCREGRAAAAVGELGLASARLAAPAELARRLGEALPGAPAVAPAELDARVAAALSVPEAGLSARLLGSLTPQGAPPALAARLAAPRGLAPQLGSPARLRRVGGPLALLAAAVLAVVLLPGAFGPRGGGDSERGPSAAFGAEPAPRVNVTFAVRRHARLDDAPFSRTERALAEGVLGELLGGGT